VGLKLRHFLHGNKNSFDGLIRRLLPIYDHICMCVELMGSDQEEGSKDSKGRGGANIMPDGKVDLKQGIGVDRNSHLCIKGVYPK
jgi:hypothetical protein